MTLKMVENPKNYTKIFDSLTKIDFRPFVNCQKYTGIFEIFGRPFLQKFQVFSGSIETVNGTQCLNCIVLSSSEMTRDFRKCVISATTCN